MNALSFDIRAPLDEEDESRVCVPVIDGRSLISRLSEFELPFQRAEGTTKIAGLYDGLPLFNVALPSRHWYGEESVYGLRDGRSAILGCECGVVDCWPFLARITVSQSTVIWSDFVQPYRSIAKDRSIWDYSGFPIFTFQRIAYDVAISMLPLDRPPVRHSPLPQ